MSLGENIYNLRKSKKLSQEKLAEKINVTRQTISNWELNVTQPNPEQLKLLSINLETTVDSLLNHNIDEIIEKEEKQNSNSINAAFSNKRLYIIIMAIMLVVILVLSIMLIINVSSNNQDDNPTGNPVDNDNMQENYSVVYNKQNGEEVEAFIVKADSLLTQPTYIPQKEGYIFDGWYYNDVKWDFLVQKVNSNIILDAKYTTLGDLKVIDSLSSHIASIDKEYDDETSYVHNQISDSRFYLLGYVDVLNDNSSGNNRIVLKTMYSTIKKVSTLGVKVDGPCIIEIKMATESSYGYTATLTELYLKNNGTMESFIKVKNVGQSVTSARITTIYYKYDEDISKTLYFGTLDRDLGIFDVKILENK